MDSRGWSMTIYNVMANLSKIIKKKRNHTCILHPHPMGFSRPFQHQKSPLKSGHSLICLAVKYSIQLYSLFQCFPSLTATIEVVTEKHIKKRRLELLAFLHFYTSKNIVFQVLCVTYCQKQPPPPKQSSVWYLLSVRALRLKCKIIW